MRSVLFTVIVGIGLILLSGCSDGALGLRGSSA